MRIDRAVGLICSLFAVSTAMAQRYSISDATSVDTSRTPLVVLSDSEAGMEAAIAPHRGGELSGLKVLHRGDWIETLYLARDYAPRQGWTGKAPLLWPATGRNFPPDLVERLDAGERFSTGAYQWNGRRYEMPIHGFARDLVWQVKRQTVSDDAAVVTLAVRDSTQTRRRYPFGFGLEVRYTLAGGSLDIACRVEAGANNRGPMPFSIGNHITFKCPLVEGSNPSDMELVTPSETEILKTNHGLPTGETRPRSHAAGIKLGKFERLSAVSLAGYRAEPFIVYRDPRGLAIRMSHHASAVPDSPVVLFNIWGDAAGGFFSPEPWVGLQNSLVLDQGLVRLEPGSHFDWTITIEFQRQP